MPTKQEIDNIFPAMLESFRPEKAEGLSATIQFELEGDNGGQYWVSIRNGAVQHGEGPADDPRMTVKAAADDFFDIAAGNTNPMQAFMMGKIKVDDMSLGMKMIQIFQFG